MSNIKNGGLDQYGAGPFEQQQFCTAGVERVKHFSSHYIALHYGFLSFITDGHSIEYTRCPVMSLSVNCAGPWIGLSAVDAFCMNDGQRLDH